MYRGIETRRVKPHVGFVTVIGVLEDNKRTVLGEAVGKVYSSEIKFLKEALKFLPYEDIDTICAIGNKGSDSIKIGIFSQPKNYSGHSSKRNLPDGSNRRTEENV